LFTDTTLFTRRIASVLLAGALLPACSSPPPTAPSAGQVAGAWVADSTLTVVSGGECVGATLQAATGRRDVFLAALAGASAIDATITSQGNGTSCAYAGSNSSGALSLKMTTCQQSRVLNMMCSSGERRDLQLVSGAITANASSTLGTGAGTDTSTWNVLVAGSAEPVGVLSLTASFNWIFLGLPASNYHVFTGTVFPGYADGTISIPADPNPWCATCGWFH
jgi:hypothetical protein